MMVSPEPKRLSAENELEMLAQLGNQTRDILALADETFATLADYRDFRDKIVEFEVFCGVIADHFAGDGGRSADLEAEFHRRWLVILRPSVAAIGRFFRRMAESGALPLGCSDMLDGEREALVALREKLQSPEFPSAADPALIGEIRRLEALLDSLAERATNFAEFN